MNNKLSSFPSLLSSCRYRPVLEHSSKPHHWGSSSVPPIPATLLTSPLDPAAGSPSWTAVGEKQAALLPMEVPTSCKLLLRTIYRYHHRLQAKYKPFPRRWAMWMSLCFSAQRAVSSCSKQPATLIPAAACPPSQLRETEARKKQGEALWEHSWSDAINNY